MKLSIDLDLNHVQWRVQVNKRDRSYHVGESVCSEHSEFMHKHAR